MTSSPKIVLYLHSNEAKSGVESLNRQHSPTKIIEWGCSICGDLNSGKNFKCETCGVPKPIRSDLEKTLWSCEICTFINEKTNSGSCEICGSKKSKLETSPSPSPISTLAPSTVGSYVKLSFRSGSASNFYSQLQAALQKKQWEVV